MGTGEGLAEGVRDLVRCDLLVFSLSLGPYSGPVCRALWVFLWGGVLMSEVTLYALLMKCV